VTPLLFVFHLLLSWDLMSPTSLPVGGCLAQPKQQVRIRDCLAQPQLQVRTGAVSFSLNYRSGQAFPCSISTTDRTIVVLGQTQLQVRTSAALLNLYYRSERECLARSISTTGQEKRLPRSASTTCVSTTCSPAQTLLQVRTRRCLAQSRLHIRTRAVRSSHTYVHLRDLPRPPTYSALHGLAVKFTLFPFLMSFTHRESPPSAV
jgi:hypothetical protein